MLVPIFANLLKFLESPKYTDLLASWSIWIFIGSVHDFLSTMDDKKPTQEC